MVKQPVDSLLYNSIIKEYCETGTCIEENDVIRLATFKPSLTPKMQEYKDRIEKKFLDNLYAPQLFEEITYEMGEKVKKLLHYMVDAN